MEGENIVGLLNFNQSAHLRVQNLIIENFILRTSNILGYRLALM